jgi:hypothetical protein
MSDELPKENRPSKSLDERFANRPHTYRRLQQIADEMDQAIADGATADEAEAMAIEQLRKLGGEMLADQTTTSLAASTSGAAQQHQAH